MSCLLCAVTNNSLEPHLYILETNITLVGHCDLVGGTGLPISAEMMLFS